MSIPYLKGYTVFNVEQIDGLPSQYYAPPPVRLAPVPRIERAEAFFAATGAAVSHGSSLAFYRPSTDSIQMPPFEMFKDAEGYYATLAHETAHWTGHASRLAREFEGKRFGSEAYAMEELVAELASAFLCADLDLAAPAGASGDAGARHLDNHASYIASWLQVLERDNRAIFTAASHAQRAAEYLHRVTGKPESAPSTVLTASPPAA
jgi:antirestriction protein ArdC